MVDVVPLAELLAGLAAVMGGCTWLARLVRRRGLAGTAVRAAMAAYEEGWHVSGYELHRELRAREDRKTPMPAPHGPRGAGDIRSR